MKKALTYILFVLLFCPLFAYGMSLEEFKLKYGDPLASYENWKKARAAGIDTSALARQRAEEGMEAARLNKDANENLQGGNLFRSDEYKFRIKFPSGWEIKDGDGAHIIKKAAKDGCTVMVLVKDFLTPEEIKSLSEQELNELESAELNDFSDEQANQFLERMIETSRLSFPGSETMEKGIRYLDNRKAAYYKISTPYKATNLKVNGVAINYVTVHKGKLYQVGGMYPTDPTNEKDKEPIINASLMTFVFEDLDNQNNSTSISENSNNPVREALESSFGENLNGFGLALALIISIIFTWGFGLLIPILLRFVILKRPLSGGVALIIVIVIYFLQLMLSLASDSKSKTHGALLLVAFVSYGIMAKGYKKKEEMRYCKECGNPVHASATICNKCNKIISRQ